MRATIRPASLFDSLFSGIDVGPIRLKNRIYITPHSTMFVSDEHDNIPGERLAAYCAERAKGGAALVEVSMAVIIIDPLSSSETYVLEQGHDFYQSERGVLHLYKIRSFEQGAGRKNCAPSAHDNVQLMVRILRGFSTIIVSSCSCVSPSFRKSGTMRFRMWS